MDVLVVADGHYYIDKEGIVYVESIFDYDFYARYLSVFDKVYAIVRAKHVEKAPQGSKKASGENIEFLQLPDTHGAKEYLKQNRKINKLIKQYVERFDCAIFRLSGSIAHLACKEYQKTKKDFAVEVIVDPWEFFSSGTVRSLMRPIVRFIWTREMKQACRKAKGVSYVTEEYLQKKYPCKALVGENGYFMAHYSSVELPDDSYGAPRTYFNKNKYIIVHVSNAFTGYGKGQIETMQVLREIHMRGYNAEVQFVGDGPLMEKFQLYAKKIGVEKKCIFWGRFPDSAAVRNVIREADMMIFPTRGEGLPRVVLEAMAEGIPVISTPVCGIPEIIEKDMLFNPLDIKGMADRVIYLINNPDKMSKISERNIKKAYEYRKSRLQKARKEFYQKVEEMGKDNFKVKQNGG